MPAVANRSSAKRRPINEINMVPFIDVMLVLLIIFMVTAPLITPSVIDLPSVGKAAKQPDRIIQVIVDKEAQLQIKTADQTQPVALNQLAARVQSAMSETTTDNSPGKSTANVAVIISADKNVKYENVVQVMDTLQRAGIQRVGLSVQLVP